MSSSSDKSLIERLRPLPEPERAAELERACLADPGLRDRLPAIADALAGGNPTVPLTSGAMSRVLESALSAADPEIPGARLGHYQLLEKIGEGGFGVVWLAEQHEPVRRRVALKIIKLGMDTRDVIARFEAERQALALMEHPNIAQVFDAGATDSGRPYFVMELVRGIPITSYCDQHRLTAEARLRLFLTVCAAVGHAHGKSIIHRDLKPSNILVALIDGVPTPKIIDFGIAKATGVRLTDKTLFTQRHTFVGTPAYTSPEQMEMSGLEIDPRSDLYSLGVLLYELLAGRTPFDPGTLAQSGFDAMRRTIREIDPPTPSQRLRTLGEQDRLSVAQRRGTELAKLSGLLRGDLDWIVMRCLEKDRTRRYESAAALAADIERHLRDEPVFARPPSTPYRLKKFFRRQRIPALAAGGIAAALIIGLLVPRAGESSAAAVAKNDKSIAVLPFENLSEDKAASAFFADGIHEDVLTQLTHVRELRVVSRQSVMEYGGSKENVRDIARKLGVAYVLQGSVRRAAGQVRVTGQLIRAATDEQIWAENYTKELSAAGVFAIQADLAEKIAAALQTALSPQEKKLLEARPTENTEAYDLYLKARAELLNNGNSTPDNIRRQENLLLAAVTLDPQFANGWAQLAIVHANFYNLSVDHTDERIAKAKAAVETAQRLAPDSPDVLHALAGYYLHCLHDYVRATAELEKLIRLQPNDWIAYADLGSVQRRQGRWAESLASFRRAAALGNDLSIATSGEIGCLLVFRRFDEAAAVQRRILERHPEVPLNGFLLGLTAFKARGSTRELDAFFAGLPEAQANSDEAISWRAAWAEMKGDFAEAIRLDRQRPPTLEVLESLGTCLAASGDVAGARLALEKLPAKIKAMLERDPTNNRYWMRLGITEALLGHADEALRCGHKGLEILPESLDASGGAFMSTRMVKIETWCGNKDRAIAELTRLLPLPGSGLNIFELKYSATYFPLHGDPRFEALINDPKNNAPLF